MKIERVGIAYREVSPVEPWQGSRRPVLAPEMGAREAKERRSARRKAVGLRKKQRLRAWHEPEERREQPEQGRLVIREQVDPALDRREVPIAVRQVPHRVGEDAEIEAVALERLVAQERHA